MINFCTLFDSNYLYRGLALYDSLLLNCDSFHLYVFSFDDKCFEILSKLQLDHATIVPLGEFEDDELLKVKKIRSTVEYFWTCTPSIILYSIKRYDLSVCTYIDADIFFFDNPKILLDELAENSVIITEHRYTKEYNRTETSGKYNVQFLTFKNDDNAIGVLRWWRARCLESCELNPNKGLCGDQKYLDMWPARFNGIHELNNIGGGVAPWNVQQYEFNMKDGKIIGFEKNTQNHFKLIFFHFHGLKMFNKRVVKLCDEGYKITNDIINLIYKPYIQTVYRKFEHIRKVDSSFNSDEMNVGTPIVKYKIPFSKKYFKPPVSNKNISNRFVFIDYIKKFLLIINKIFKEHLCITTAFKSIYMPKHYYMDTLNCIRLEINCPICQSNNNAIITELYDDRYGYPGRFHLLKCLDCRHKYLNCDMSNEQTSKLYTNYYPRSSFNANDYKAQGEIKGFSSWFNGDYRAFAAVPRDVKILDIGCGFGEALGYHKNRGCDVYGVEADENVEKVAEKYDFNIKIGLFNSKDYNNNFFDYVTMDQVLEHNNNPIQFLKDINVILKDEGRIVITIPNSNGWGVKVFGRKWINWHVPYHLQFFSKKSIKIASIKSGFAIEKIKTITSSNWLYYQELHNLNYPEEGYESVFWKRKDSIENNKLYKIKTYLIRLMYKFKVYHVITRVFDIIGAGDNFFIILKKINNI